MRYDPMDSADLDRQTFTAGDTRTQRSQQRDSLFLSGQLTLAGDKGPRDVRIRNLSENGLMVDLGRVVAIGSAVSLVLRGVGEVAGKVAWCAEGRIGIALDHPIDPQLARKPVVGGTRTPLYAKPQLGKSRA